MKLVMDFYIQMQIEGNKRGKSEKAACRPLSPERNQGKKHFNGLRQEGTQEEHQVKQVPEETAEKKLSHPPISSEKKLEDGRPQGSYIVGGSVSGLNFITFTNRKPPVYYGATKESYLSSLCKS